MSDIEDRKKTRIAALHAEIELIIKPMNCIGEMRIRAMKLRQSVTTGRTGWKKSGANLLNDTKHNLVALVAALMPRQP
jgi:hypothetical protein